jgi:hypothetical protein
MLTRIIVFLLIEAAGVGLLIKTDPLIRFIGRISFAEKVFGPTGTYTFLRLFGGLLMFGGLVYLTGTWQHMMNSIFGVQ